MVALEKWVDKEQAELANSYISNNSNSFTAAPMLLQAIDHNCSAPLDYLIKGTSSKTKKDISKNIISKPISLSARFEDTMKN